MHPRHLSDYVLLLVFVVLLTCEWYVLRDYNKSQYHHVDVERNSRVDSHIYFQDSDSTIPPPSVEIQSPPQHEYDTKEQYRRGYVLAMSYYDQMTGAISRMTALQCWASQHNMAVVEPFIPSNSTYPGMPAVGEKASESLRVGDLFDIPQWNNFTADFQENGSMSFSPIASWEDFLENAPRDVIAVQIIHMLTEPYSLPCTYPQINSYWNSTFEPHGFKVSRRVCIDLNELGLLNEDDFNRLIFGSYSTSVTLLFDQWRGTSTRVPGVTITLKSSCTGLSFITIQGLLPSPKCIHDAEKYTKQHFKDQRFITVMLRLEVAIQASSDMGLTCLEKFTVRLGKIREGHPEKSIFVTTDIGTYGTQSLESDSVRNYPSAYFFDYNKRIFEFLFGEKALGTMKEYSEGFENIGFSNHPAYIGNLQKAVASKGDCIYHVGEGHFQKHAAAWQGGKCFKNIVCQDLHWRNIVENATKTR